MPSRPSLLLCLTFLWLALSPLPAHAQAECKDDPWALGWQPHWTPLFQGVDWMRVCTQTLPVKAPPSVKRIQMANALRIDLKHPGVQIVSSPGIKDEGAKPMTISEFVCTSGTQVAINANFSWYNCPQEGVSAVFGLAVSQGATISNADNVPGVRYAGAQALIFTRDNQAYFQTITRGSRIPHDTWNAIAGSPQPRKGSCQPQETVPGPLMLATRGINRASVESERTPTPPEVVAARTAVGLSKDRRYLYLLAIDGADGTECGAAFYDAASWMLRIGAYNALNLDGGGSTSMAMDAGDGGVRLLNVPSADHSTPCFQRTVPTFLGVKAPALASPARPASCCSVVSCSDPNYGSTSTCSSSSGVCPPLVPRRSEPNP